MSGDSTPLESDGTFFLPEFENTTFVRQPSFQVPDNELSVKFLTERAKVKMWKRIIRVWLHDILIPCVYIAFFVIGFPVACFRYLYTGQNPFILFWDWCTKAVLFLLVCCRDNTYSYYKHDLFAILSVLMQSLVLKALDAAFLIATTGYYFSKLFHDMIGTKQLLFSGYFAYLVLQVCTMFIYVPEFHTLDTCRWIQTPMRIVTLSYIAFLLYMICDRQIQEPFIFISIMMQFPFQLCQVYYFSLTMYSFSLDISGCSIVRIQKAELQKVRISYMGLHSNLTQFIRSHQISIFLGMLIHPICIAFFIIHFFSSMIPFKEDNQLLIYFCFYQNCFQFIFYWQILNFYRSVRDFWRRLLRTCFDADTCMRMGALERTLSKFFPVTLTLFDFLTLGSWLLKVGILVCVTSIGLFLGLLIRG